MAMMPLFPIYRETDTEELYKKAEDALRRLRKAKTVPIYPFES